MTAADRSRKLLRCKTNNGKRRDLIAEDIPGSSLCYFNLVPGLNEAENIFKQASTERKYTF